MSKPIAFRFPDETVADIDIVATHLGCDRKEAVCRGMADYRARVTGLVPASTIELLPPLVFASEDAPADRGTIPADDEVAVIYPDDSVEPTPPPPGPRFQARPATNVGPVQSLRSRPIMVPDTPRVHRLLNPITKGRMS